MKKDFCSDCNYHHICDVSPGLRDKCVPDVNDVTTISGLVSALIAIQNNTNIDPESAHWMADNLLLKYINNEEVTKAFESIEMWYA